MYILNSGKIKWKSKLSANIDMSSGLKQGAILSPYLFNIYLEPLITKINKSGFGCYIGNKPMGILSYADDIVILTPTKNSLLNIISILENFSESHCINFNPSKSFIMFYSDYLVIENVNIFMKGQKINFEKEGKHLGFNLLNNRNFYSLDRITNDMYIRSNVVKRSFNSLSTDCKIKLFNTHCINLYGSELLNLQDEHIENLQIAWRKCVRSVLNIPYRTRSILIPGLVGSSPIIDMIYERQLNFITKGLYNDNNVVSFVFKNSLLFSKSYVIRNVNIILRHYEILYEELFLKKKFKFKYSSECDWRINMIKEMLHMRDFNLLEFLNVEELNLFINWLCCF